MLKTLDRILQKLQHRTAHKEHTDVEAERGRRIGTGDIERFTLRLWDTTSKLRTMERLLRKQSSRDSKGEGVPKKENTDAERNLRLKRLYEHKDFEIIKEVLMEAETYAYYGLRHPELKREEVTTDYYNGTLNGQLSLIEHIRKQFEDAVIKIEKQKIIENQKNNGQTK